VSCSMYILVFFEYSNSIVLSLFQILVPLSADTAATS